MANISGAVGEDASPQELQTWKKSVTLCFIQGIGIKQDTISACHTITRNDKVKHYGLQKGKAKLNY